MRHFTKVQFTITAASILALAVSGSVLLYYPLSPTSEWYIAFGALLALSLLSTALALTVTEGGTSTSMDFLPELGAVLLLGPSGAVVLTAIAESVSQFIFHKKSASKAIFNTAQFTIAIGCAGIIYVTLGGTPSLQELRFSQTFAPFVVAAIVMFLINAVSVAYIISVANSKPFRDVWEHVMGSIILFDIAISPLSYLVALLYVRYGAATLVLAIVPIVGLRYSYGVNLELKQLNRDLLRVLIKALEGRDTYTSGHSVRVAEYAKAICEDLNLSRNDIRTIETAALLHDIGKIDPVYMRILRETGPLSPEQRQVIEEHPQRGVDIIKSIRSLDPYILKCVLHHHERWDGTGYPRGLAGEDIPLGARVIMVADTIDAMSTARPYRDPLDPEIIREELNQEQGAQFDPDIAKIALRCSLIWEALDKSLVELPDAEASTEPDLSLAESSRRTS